MVRDLEHVGGKRPARGREAPLGRPFDVAGEQDRAAAKRKAHHERARVSAARAALWPKRLDARAVDVERLTRFERRRGHARRGEPHEEPPLALSAARGHESPADAQLAQDRVETTRVVLVAVRRHDVVERADAEREQRLAHDSLTGIERLRDHRLPVFVAEQCVRAGAASCVHEHRRAAWEPYERGVALAYVEKEHVKSPVRGRTPGREREERRRHRRDSDENRAACRARAPSRGELFERARHGPPARGSDRETRERRHEHPRERGAPSKRRGHAAARRHGGRLGAPVRSLDERGEHRRERCGRARRERLEPEIGKPTHERRAEQRLDRHRREERNRGHAVEVLDRCGKKRRLGRERCEQALCGKAERALETEGAKRARRLGLVGAIAQEPVPPHARGAPRAPEEHGGDDRYGARTTGRVGRRAARLPGADVREPGRDWRRQEHDCGNGGERQLEARVEERVRVTDERRERGRGDGVGWRRAAEHEGCRESNRDRDRSAHGGGGGPKCKRVCPDRDGTRGESRDGRSSEASDRPEQHRGDECDVRARDDEHVEHAGIAIAAGHVAIEPARVAEQEGAQHPRGACSERGVDDRERPLPRGVERPEDGRALADARHRDARGRRA